MNDDGINGDVMAGDGIYSAPVPTKNNSNTKFYIRASNKNAIQLSPERAEYEFYVFSPELKNGANEDSSEIVVYPSPTQGILYVKGNFQDSTPFKICSSMGEIVLTGSLYSQQNLVDLSRFSSGLYFLKINSKTFKIVKTN